MNQMLMSPDQNHKVNHESTPSFEAGREIQPAAAEQAPQQFEQPANTEQAAQLEAMTRQPSAAEVNFLTPIRDILASRNQYMERYTMAQSLRPSGALGAIGKVIISFRINSLVHSRHQEVKKREAELGGQIVAEHARDGQEHIFFADQDDSGCFVTWVRGGETTFIRETGGILKARTMDKHDDYAPLPDQEAHTVYNLLSHYRQRITEAHN